MCNAALQNKENAYQFAEPSYSFEKVITAFHSYSGYDP